MNLCSRIHIRFLIISVILFLASTSIHAQYDPDLFSSMKARSIGPAGMSGRIGDVEAVVSNPKEE